MIPAEHGRAYAKAIPDARFLLLPEAGHLPQFEAPGGRRADGVRPASVRIIEDGSTTAHRGA